MRMLIYIFPTSCGVAVGALTDSDVSLRPGDQV